VLLVLVVEVIGLQVAEVVLLDQVELPVKEVDLVVLMLVVEMDHPLLLWDLEEIPDYKAPAAVAVDRKEVILVILHIMVVLAVPVS
jgi:hypothetical protein